MLDLATRDFGNVSCKTEILYFSTVVERKLMSEFGNVMKRQKLIARIQELFSHHDRVYLLIEQDRTKRSN